MALTEMTLQNSIIRYATDFDSCILCANEYAKENNISYLAARSELSGHLQGEKIFKINVNDTCICKKHIREISEMLVDA